MTVEGVMCRLVTPFAVFEPWFRLLVLRVFNGINARSKDVLGDMPVHGQVDNGAGV